MVRISESRQFVRRALPIIVLCIAGCGPTAQEKYATALSILDQEERSLKAHEQEFDAACEDAYQTLCNEFQAVDYHKAKQNLTERPVVPVPDFASDDMRALAHEASDTMVKLAKIDLEVANSAIAKAKQNGTKEALRLDALTKGLPEVQVYREQRKRVEQARQVVEKARADL